MSLTQDGSAGGGTYANGRRIQGMVIGDSFNGTWASSKDDGWFTFTMSPDCATFDGTWGQRDVVVGEPWTGRRVTSVEALPPPMVEELASGLRVPWSLGFGQNGDIWVTQQPCLLTVLRSEPVSLTVPGCVDVGDGVRGLQLDPASPGACDSAVYLVYTHRRSEGDLATRVGRFRLDCTDGLRLADEQVLLGGVPGADIHTAGRLKFGPDGNLYLATGDALNTSLSQNPDSLGGKILRFNTDGSVPSDNPTPGSYVYSLGHRNPQGLAWQPSTGDLWITDHGPSPTIAGEPFVCCHDEINRIVPGGNYGWPIVAGAIADPRFVSPALESGLGTWAPSGAAFYRGSAVAQWDGSLLFGTLIGQHLGRVTFASPAFTTVATHEQLLNGAFGRLREVVEGPDGYLYLTTSNIDGRSGAQARTGDDRVLRIVAVPSLTERQAVVRAAYLSTLGREADGEGLIFWTYTHHPASTLAATMSAAAEGERVAAVRALYRELLDRDPIVGDRPGLRYWVDMGQPVERIRDGMFTSEEYRSKHG